MKIKNFTFITLFFLLSLSLNFSYAQGTHKAVKLGSSSAAYGYYEYLPTNFSKNSGKFPLLIFLHGAGEKGNGKDQLNRAIKFGPGREIENGKNFPFVILSPQTNEWWDAKKLNDLIDLAIKNYNVDPNRVYMTGLSMGAMGTFHFAASYPDRLAAMVGYAGKADNRKVCRYSNVPLWAFHGDKDPTVHVSGSISLVDAYNKCNPSPKTKAKLTILQGQKHWGWNEIYNGSKADIYSWMLQFSKNGKTNQPKTVAPNKAPVVNAGNDKSVTLPLAELYISGSAKDEDGSVKSYKWEKVSGPAVEMSGTNSNKLKLKKLNSGNYIFRLTAKDNSGAGASDEMKLEVKAAPTNKQEDTPNKAPIVSAGNDQSVTLPLAELYINGSARDEDGSIKSYKWEKVSGPGIDMSGKSSNKLKLKKLNKGEYVFRLTAKDNSGKTASDEMKLQVKEAAASKPKASSVTANAGSDKTITLPADKESLHGYAKFVNSSARIYKWEKVSGPSVKMTGSGANRSLTRLQEGEYVFRFIVENNKGQRHSDDMILKVKKGKGSKSDEPKPVSNPQPQPANEPVPDEVAEGLQYTYYKIDPKKPWTKLPDFRKLKPAKTGRVSNFTLSPRDQNDYFAFAFDGNIKIDNAGDYYFYTYSDEGTKLYINDKLVTNNDGLHTSVVKYGKVNLSKGSHKIRVEYFENKAGEQLYVSYKGPGVALQEIPKSRLSTGNNNTNNETKSEGPKVAFTSGLNYSYYESKDAHSRWTKLPDFKRLNAKKTGTVADFSLSPALRTNHFGLVLEGQIKIAKGGDYTFYSYSDDGSQLFIDGQKIVDNDGLHAPRERSGKVRLSEGYHAIRVVYHEYEGWEKLEVKWQGPGIGKQIIPASVLYRKSNAGKKQMLAQSNELAGDFTEEESLAGVKLYPNPAQNYIQVQTGNTDEEAVTISIMDLSGRSLYQGNHQIAGGEAVSINLQDLHIEKGAYVLTVKGSRQNMQKAFRFIKE